MSAFADNAIFFTILAYLAKHGEANPDLKMATVQAAFLVAFVLLAPIVGAIADKNPKSNILAIGNLIKALGIIALLLGISPIISYGIVGIGAVVYSPAKYGILTELTNTEEELLKANSKIESFTIVAILLGTIAGGAVSTVSVLLGILTCLAMYNASLIMSIYIPKQPGNNTISYTVSIKEFFSDIKQLAKNNTTRFSLVGTSSFWMTSTVLRLAFIVWLATYLGIKSPAEQSAIVGVTAIGIVIGALITPKLIKASKFYTVYKYGIALVLTICASYFIHNLIMTIVLLNTVVQERGKCLIGSGKTIAIQNFCENSFMLLGIGLYKFAISNGVHINLAIVGIGAILSIFVLYLFREASKLRKII